MVDDIKIQYKLVHLIVLFILMTCLISFNASANEITGPDYGRFKDRLTVFAISFIFAFILLRVLAKHSSFLIKRDKMQQILDTNILEYALRICISTTAFYIIGLGLFTNSSWDRGLLIETIIICLFAFFIDIMVLRFLRKIDKRLNPHQSFFHSSHSSMSIYLSFFVLIILLINYIELI